MSRSWIAQRLELGTWTYVSNRLSAGAAASPGQELLPLGQEWGHLFSFGYPAYTSLGYEAKLGMNSQFVRQYQLSRKEFLTNNSSAKEMCT